MNINPQHLVQRAIQFLKTDLWLLEPQDHSLWVGRGIRIAQAGYLCWLRYNESRSAVRAWSLTAITIFSMVPVMAFAFSIAKGFGLYENLHTDVIEPILMTWLELEQLPELSEAFSQLISFIETTDLRSLGLVGFITVAYSVIRLMSAVEESLNDIWGAPSARSFVRKVSDYLSVSLVVPILLLVGATGSTAFHLDDAIAAMEAWGWFGALLVRFGVLVVVWLGFMVIYMIMPNISIQPRAAAYGGVVGGSLWLLVHQAHVSLQVGVANYNALYAGFSAFPIFMIWVYASWVSLLLGAVFASAQQNLDAHRQDIIRSSLLFCDRERLCLRILLRLARRYNSGKPLYTKDELEDELGSTHAAIDVAVADLERAALVAQSHQDEVVLIRSPDHIELVDVIEAVMARRVMGDMDNYAPDVQEVIKIYQRFYGAVRTLPSNLNLSTLADQPVPIVSLVGDRHGDDAD